MMQRERHAFKQALAASEKKQEKQKIVEGK